MKFISDIFLRLKSDEQLVQKAKALKEQLVLLQAEKELLVEQGDTINKALTSEDFDSKLDILDRGSDFNKTYVNQLASIKHQELKLQEKLNSINKSISDRFTEDKAKAILKSLYRSGKLSLEMFDKAAGEKTDAGQTKYADILVLNTDGELLLLKRSVWEDQHQGAWVVPGGHVDKGEDDETAAKRELLEESGISVDNLMHRQNIVKPYWTQLGIYKDKNVNIAYFSLSNVNIDDIEILLDDAESRDYQWIKREEIDNYPMVYNMQDNVKKMLGWEAVPQVKLIRKTITTNLIDMDRLEHFQKLSKADKEEIKKALDHIDDQIEKGILPKDALEKAMRNLTHLIPKKVSVRGQDGTMHQAIRWVLPDGEQAEKVIAKDDFKSTGDFDEDVAHVVFSDSSARAKLRGLVNLGIYDRTLLSVLSGVSFGQVTQFIKNDAELDITSLPRSQDAKLREVIKGEQAKLNGPEGREGAGILRSISVERLWDCYRDNLAAAIEGEHKFVLAYGAGGVGKTYEFDKLAEQYELREFEEEIQPDKDQYDFVVVKGKISPAQVYAELYRHRDKLIVFDDCDSFLIQEAVQGWLKGGLDMGGNNKISNKTSKKVYNIEGDKESGEIPSSFRFTGQVIAISNLTADQIEPAVLSRALASNLSMTVEETMAKLSGIRDKLKIMNANKTEEVVIDPELRELAFEVLEANKEKLGNELNTRTLMNAMSIARRSKKRGLDNKDTKDAIEAFFDAVVGEFDKQLRFQSKSKTK